MKKSEIVVGGTYRNATGTERLVFSDDPFGNLAHFQVVAVGDKDANRVRLGSMRCCAKVSFAAWAKERVY
jgi:hypothetical protein